MNIANIKYYDIANGDGVRTSIFVSGCTRHCKGCFNDIAWDFDYGVPFTDEIEQKIYDSMNERVAGISVLGGEPLEPRNKYDVLFFIKRFKRRFPNKTVWLYTGYKYEELDAYDLEYVDVLVDGEFVEDEKDITLEFRGSRNQRIIKLR